MTDAKMTIKDLVAATQRSARTLHQVAVQYELYTGDQIERVKQRHLLILQFTPEQFEIIQNAVAYVSEQQGDYLDFFKAHTTPHHRRSSHDAEPLTITAKDWHAFLERFTALEEKVARVETESANIKADTDVLIGSLSDIQEDFKAMTSGLDTYLQPQLKTSVTNTEG